MLWHQKPLLPAAAATFQITSKSLSRQPHFQFMLSPPPKSIDTNIIGEPRGCRLPRKTFTCTIRNVIRQKTTLPPKNEQIFTLLNNLIHKIFPPDSDDDDDSISARLPFAFSNTEEISENFICSQFELKWNAINFWGWFFFSFGRNFRFVNI